MPCHWLMKGSKDFCNRPTKNEYCGMHPFAINKRRSKPPIPCKICGNGTNSKTQLCIPCGQNKELSKLWRERQVLVN